MDDKVCYPATLNATQERIFVRWAQPKEFARTPYDPDLVRTLPNGDDAFDMGTGNGLYKADEVTFVIE